MQETVEKNDQKTKNKDEVSTATFSTSRETQSYSWSNLKKRYKNLWRTRLKDKNYKKGILNSFLAGGASSLFFLLMTPAYPIFGAILYFYIGSIFGSGLAGYRNNLDAFGGFHVGLASSTLLVGFFIIASLLTNPMIGIAIAPIMIFYLAIISLSHAIYAGFGKQAKEEQKNKKKK
jgi:hypothetical protein